MNEPAGRGAGWRPSPRRNGRALAATAAAAIVVSTVLAIFNSRCIDLVIASSNEKFQLLTEIASSYRAPLVDRRCVTVQIIPKASGSAERALRHDWKDEPADLPKPHVWFPAASAWLVLLSQHRTDDRLADILPPVAPSIMQSPLVIAMHQKMADVLHAQIGPRIGWQQVFDLAKDPQGWASYGNPSWGRFKLGKTNPNTSTSGLHALISVNYASEAPDAPADFLTTIEGSVEHYADSVGTLLSNLYAADQNGTALTYVSAVAVEEKQAFDYNRGNPRSELCRPLCPSTQPNEKLVAVFPAGGTLVADHPYAILEWTDPARREAALDFEQYLTSAAIQRLFQAEGFRNNRGEASAVLASPFFTPSGPKSTWFWPDPPKLVEMLGLWSRDFRKPAHALFVLDVGRSMLQSATPGKAKLDVAIRASSDAFAELAPYDGIGLWVFPTSSGPPYREVSPPFTLAPDTVELIRKQVGVDSSVDEASFYATIRASVDRVQSTFVKTRINAVVVLTAGDYQLNDTKGYADLIAYLQHQPDDLRVRIFVISYGSPARGVLKQIAESSRGVFYEVTDQVNIGDVVRNAMSNF